MQSNRNFVCNNLYITKLQKTPKKTFFNLKKKSAAGISAARIFCRLAFSAAKILPQNSKQEICSHETHSAAWKICRQNFTFWKICRQNSTFRKICRNNSTSWKFCRQNSTFRKSAAKVLPPSAAKVLLPSAAKNLPSSSFAVTICCQVSAAFLFCCQKCLLFNTVALLILISKLICLVTPESGLQISVGFMFKPKSNNS